MSGEWQWEWEWVRELRGRVCRDFEELTNLLQNFVIVINCRDQWKWVLQENGVFTVNELLRMVEERILRIERRVKKLYGTNGCQKK